MESVNVDQIEPEKKVIGVGEPQNEPLPAYDGEVTETENNDDPPAYTVPFIDLLAYENPESVTVEPPKEEEYEPRRRLPRYDDAIRDRYQHHPKFTKYAANNRGKIINTGSGIKVRDSERRERTIIITDDDGVKHRCFRAEFVWEYYNGMLLIPEQSLYCLDGDITVT